MTISEIDVDDFVVVFAVQQPQKVDSGVGCKRFRVEKKDWSIKLHRRPKPATDSGEPPLLARIVVYRKSMGRSRSGNSITVEEPAKTLFA